MPTKNLIDENEIKTKDKLFHYVEIFSFPRLAGSEGEKSAVKLTTETFKKIGFNESKIQRQEFEFSTFYSEELIKIIAFMSLILIAVLSFIKYLFPVLFFLTVIGIFIVFLSMIKVLKHPELKGFWENHFGKKISATNVIVKIPARKIPFEHANNLIISAHLDSKSQTVKTIWRVIFFIVWEIGGITLLILFALFLIDFYFGTFKIILIVLESCIIIILSVVIISIFMIIIIKTGNKSRGALDNASGMALVFELSSIFRIAPLNNFNLWFCQFSAEEIGTMGSRFFVDTHEDFFNKGKTLHINFDMVSNINSRKGGVEYIKSYGFLFKKNASHLLDSYINTSADEQKIKIYGHRVLNGGHTDSIPFHLRKYDSIDITTLSTTKYSHGRSDTPDKIDSQVLLETFKVIRRVISMLDEGEIEELS